MKRVLTVLACLLTSAMNCSTFAQDHLVFEGEEGIGQGKHIVLIANDHEYRSEQTCPLLAKMLAKHFGFRCTVLFGLDEDGNIKPGAKNLPGMEALAEADMLVFFTRFMNLPDDQADVLVDYFERGGPVVAMRTSTHCFNGQKGKWAKLNFNYNGEEYLGGLGEQVLGCTWHKERGQSHYGSNHVRGCRITPVASAKAHPILQGVNQIHAYSGAYESKPLADATQLLEVQVLETFGPSDNFMADKPLVNAGWVRESYLAPSGTKQTARVVYGSFGASEDLKSEDCRRFFVNACLWAAGMEAEITPDLDVSIVGEFSPTPYTTGSYYYKGVKPADLAGWDTAVMPESFDIAGADNPKTAKKMKRALANRPELKARMMERYPANFGEAPMKKGEDQ